LLTFVIPVRHHASVADWGALQPIMAATFRSVAAQAGGMWRLIVVANRGAELPALPRNAELVEVDFERPALPPRNADPERHLNLTLLDKGRRVLAGLLHARPTGHVMVVDYDDLVSNRLAAFVASDPEAYGWSLGSGYFYAGGEEAIFLGGQFHRHCGTSHIVRADLLELPSEFGAADDTQVLRWLGEHVFIRADLRERGTPLDLLPFPGALYRIGHLNSMSRSPGLDGYIRRELRRLGDTAEARRTIERRMRKVDAAFAAEFLGG
jgi:hypothetical protein